MATTLLSFLGRGPYSADGQRRPYWQTQYQFDAWTSAEVSFFLRAALDWLSTQKYRKPDRLIILGTAGSMWDELLMFLGGKPLAQPIEDLYYGLVAKVDSQSTSGPEIAQVEQELARTLGVEVHCELIPPGQTAQDQALVLDSLQRYVQVGDRVFLDVTHGFRHQPMLALGAAVLLARLRGAEIEDILYGANDMRVGSGPAPVVSLRWLLDLLDWADTIGQLRAGGRLRALTKVVKDGGLQKALADTAFLLTTNQVHQAGVAAKQCQLVLAGVVADPIIDLTRNAIDGALGDVAGCQRDARGILNVARAALREQDYVRAATLLAEAVDKHKEATGNKLDTNWQIHDLRNALAHASLSQSNRAFVKQALVSRDELERTMREQFERVAKHLGGA